MAVRTGRKTVASEDTRRRAISIKKANPSMSNSQIADRLNGVTARQVQYWLKLAKQNGETKCD